MNHRIILTDTEMRILQEALESFIFSTQVGRCTASERDMEHDDMAATLLALIRSRLS